MYFFSFKIERVTCKYNYIWEYDANDLALSRKKVVEYLSIMRTFVLKKQIEAFTYHTLSHILSHILPFQKLENVLWKTLLLEKILLE